MAKRLEALAALSEILSSVPNNHIEAHNHLQWDLMSSSIMQAYSANSTHIHK